MKKSLPEFGKKAISLVMIGSENSRMIVDARFEWQAGRLFLVGRIPKGGSTRDWCINHRTAFAWERVEEYLVFDSEQHYNERLALFNRKKKRKA